MKYCKYCGKELTSEQRHNKYCSHTCANNAKKDIRISAWKNNKEIIKNGNLSKTIREYLLAKHDYKCEKCGWGEINLITNKVPLEIHHKDGNYLNNDESNLEVLCPNCHSLTANYKSLNKSLRYRVVARKNYCCDCGIEISTYALRCCSCASKHRYSKELPTREELKNLIRNISFTQIGKQYNVSDNAVRKWCISYNLPYKRKDIKEYSDEEWISL